jgi:glyoxylase-like metal-dependent hydrolase (beta-lactamase superfamily II)
MFGVVPKPLWEKCLPPDEKNRIRLAMRALVFQRAMDGLWCMIDCGAGLRWDAKHASIYGIDVTRDYVREGLVAVGLSLGLDLKPTDIRCFIATHLHFDHIGGLVREDTDGKLVPTFPNALHFIHKRHWEYALRPTERDHASFRREDYLPLEHQVEIEWLEESETPLFEGQVVSRSVHGHTPHMQILDIRLGDKVLTYTADLVPTVHHVRLPYIMGYDLQPLQTLAEKKDLFSRMALNPRQALFLEHDPVTECVRVRRSDHQWEVLESSTLAAFISPGKG